MYMYKGNRELQSKSAPCSHDWNSKKFQEHDFFIDQSHQGGGGTKISGIYEY